MKKFKSMLAVLLAMLMIFSCAAVSYATDDGNGSAATATKLGTDNAGAKGFIEAADDKDYYYWGIVNLICETPNTLKNEEVEALL